MFLSSWVSCTIVSVFATDFQLSFQNKAVEDGYFPFGLSAEVTFSATDRATDE